MLSRWSFAALKVKYRFQKERKAVSTNAKRMREGVEGDFRKKEIYTKRGCTAKTSSSPKGMTFQGPNRGEGSL